MFFLCGKTELLIRTEHLTRDGGFASRNAQDSKWQIKIFFYENQCHRNNHTLDIFLPHCHSVPHWKFKQFAVLSHSRSF